MKTTANRRTTILQAAQRGQAMVEYAVICTILTAALFAPIPGDSKGRAVGQLLADSVRAFYAAVTFFVSLP